jgi:hypothetical protein
MSWRHLVPRPAKIARRRMDMRSCVARRFAAEIKVAILRYSGRCSEYDAMRIIFLPSLVFSHFRYYLICVL